MDLEVFTKEDFAVFEIEGLKERMTAIREKIQPKFYQLGDFFSKKLALQLDGDNLPVHVAQHLRRTKNAPDSTWVAIGGDKRGYKKYPHFQLSLEKERIYIWLAFIDQPLFEKEMANSFLECPDSILRLPEDFIVSLDHTKPQATPIKETDIKGSLERWRDLKKGEFLIGRELSFDSPILENAEIFKNYVMETFISLLPLYKQAVYVRAEIV